MEQSDLTVRRIKDGTVIDHIDVGNGLKVLKALQIDGSDGNVITIALNVPSGKLKKLEAVEMITKELKLDGKIVIPIKLQNHTGQPKITGVFYVYDDEKLAKEHVDPTIFARLDKAKNAGKEKKDEQVADAEPAKADAPTDKPDTKDKSENN